MPISPKSSPLTEDGQDDLAPVLVADHDLEAAGQHQIDIVGPIACTHHGLPAREPAHHRHAGDIAQRFVRQTMEKRERLQGNDGNGGGLGHAHSGKHETGQ
jgi:hypothetical protein